jgi:uncharacterized protein YciI
MWKKSIAVIGGLVFLAAGPVAAQGEASSQAPQYDAALAKSLGADDMGMHKYVLVVLKTGPHRMPDGEARNKMFEGHMANIRRLAGEKKLVLAGPLDGADGWRGLFVLATPDIEQAKKFVATDPTIINGELVAEYHVFYGSAGLMMLNEIHSKIEKKPAG